MLNMSGGAEFWQPLTGAVIFGLAFATVLTLLVTPSLLMLRARRIMKRRDRAEAHDGSGLPEPAAAE